uniref:Uncharacterized protein n=1 Tax=Timema douglasi TaxID=61478 RepID=A0A7R8Z813_TIMDO|nr:unnamed protein product [Timema douglasi]
MYKLRHRFGNIQSDSTLYLYLPSLDSGCALRVVEFLDEYHPGSFRQAQVSFSTRIPNAFPLGDAMTMSTNVCLYNAYGCHLNYRDVLKAPSASKGPVSAATAEENGETLPSVLEEDTEAAATDNPDDESNDTKTPNQNGSGSSVGVDSGTGGNLSDIVSGDPSPAISMVSKHSNGTLNLWQLTFGDHSKFSQVLSIGHSSRASGHRFRVNDITCHPVLPLLLTTSHHNITDVPGTPVTISPHNKDDNYSTFTVSPTNHHGGNKGFCSELILWRVDAVGPLSKSGGVSELARINSPEISAFSNVAWIPTLLPSTTLGNLSNSPSACFVASDGKSLRVYQAVIDARTLLAEVSSSERRSRMMDSMVSLSTDTSSEDGVRHSSLHDKIKIVSQQSTARPGCVIQLDAISDATHDWQNTQFLHVFQEQLITGERAEEKTVNPDLGFMETQLAAMVDLQQSSVFEEPFYIVVLERTNKGTVVHMWRLVIASQPDSAELTGSMMYVPDSHLIQDEDDGEERQGRSASMSAGDQLGEHALPVQASHVVISTTKVCTQDLPLPDGVEVVHAAPAAGHLSSASIYPACFAPYIVVTACSDSTIRYISLFPFWKCKVDKVSKTAERSYDWCEWEMLRKDQESTIDITDSLTSAAREYSPVATLSHLVMIFVLLCVPIAPTGQPLNISAGYSGRIACAYKYGKSFTRPSKNDPDSRYVNLCVAIYECESTGEVIVGCESPAGEFGVRAQEVSVWCESTRGSEWVLEDTIHLKNIHLPRIQVDPHLDLSYLYDSRFLQKKQRLNHLIQALSSEDVRSLKNGDMVNTGHSNELHPKSGTGLLAVPSFSTLQSLRKSIIECGNTCPLTQKHLVQLDWVSKEDGSHILTVAVGSKVSRSHSQTHCGCPHILTVAVCSKVSRSPSQTLCGCSHILTVAVGSKVSRSHSQTLCGCSHILTVAVGSKVSRSLSQTLCGCSHILTVAVGSRVSRSHSQTLCGCSHILTVAVGSKVMLFTPVSSDLAQANMKAMKESQTTNRPILRKASSLAVPQFVDEIRQGLNRNVNNCGTYLKEPFNLRGPHFTAELSPPFTTVVNYSPVVKGMVF